MIDVLPVKTGASAATPATGAPAATGCGPLAAFGALFDDAGQAPAVGASGLPDDRQSEADDGKTLPDDTDTQAPPALDPRLAWLPFALPEVPQAAVPVAANPIAGTAQAAAVVNSTNTPIAAPEPDAKTKTDDIVTTDLDQIADTAAPSNRLMAMMQAAEKLASAQAAKAGVPLTSPAPAAAPAPVGPAFNAAVDAAVQPLRDDRKKPVFEPTASTASLTTEAVLRHAVQATGDARNVPLDLAGDHGLQRMIDRIETLRDDANANDTHIRLVPDALGGVDVSVRRAGDALHVSFTTDTEHARALIAEAQPRLVEFADARGVRIADSSVQTGTGSDRSGQQQPFQQAPQQAPRPAPAIASTITDSSDDDRLA